MPGFHLVVLGPMEPSPDLVDLITSPLFEGRLFYIVGSALNMQDLLKARADTAAAVMFQSNPQLDTVGTVLDDVATVLRTMSVINFNPNLKCLVQVLQSSDRNLLKDSNADIVLCMDDYKTTLQARNAMCPGLATFVENIFHTFGSGVNGAKPTEHWVSEYKYGLQMELYYVNIAETLFKKLNFNWALLVEAIYVEFDCILLGVCRASDHSVCLNPGRANYLKFQSPGPHAFFKSYTTGVLLAPDDVSANAIAFALTDEFLMESLLNSLVSAEDLFAVRTLVVSPAQVSRQAIQGLSTTDPAATSSSAGMGSRAMRRVSVTLGRGGLGGPALTPHQKAMTAMNESQNLLDIDFTPDLKRYLKNSKSKRRKYVSRQQHDSDSSDDYEGDDKFLGYLDSDSEELEESESSDNCNNKSKHNFHGVKEQKNEGKEKQKEERLDESSIVKIPMEMSARERLSNIFKRVVKDIRKEKHGAWINVIRGLNIHGEVEVVDDVFRLGLLRTERRRPSGAVAICGGNQKLSKFGKKRVVGRLASAQFVSAAHVISAFSPTKKETKPKLSIKGAGKRVTASLALNLKKTSAPSQDDKKLQETKSQDQTSEETPAEESSQGVTEEESKQPERLILNQRMRGFQKKKSSSFSENYDCSSTRDASLRANTKSRSAHSSAGHSKSAFVKRRLSSNTFSSSDDDEDDISRVTLPERQAEASFFELKQSKKQSPRKPLQTEWLGCLTESEFMSKDSVDECSFSKKFRSKSTEKVLKQNSHSDKSFDFDQHEAGSDFGRSSTKVTDANKLRGHIIVMGCLDNVLLFVRELRRPQPGDLSYHSVLLVGEKAPEKWEHIQKHFDDVYFLQNQIRSREELELEHMNVKHAHSLVLLATRERHSVDEATNIDSAAIFTYLKLHTCVPRNVFFTVELFLESSIGMLNSVVMRHLKNIDDEEKCFVRSNSFVSTGIAVSRSRPKSIIMKVSGTADMSLQFREMSLLSLAETNIDFDDDERNEMLREVTAERELRKKKPQSISLSGSASPVPSPSCRPNKVAPSSAKSLRRMLMEDKTVGKIILKDSLVKDAETKRAREQQSLTQASLFWDTDGTHQILPVFAASLVFVPTGFDSIFCNVRILLLC